MTQIEIVSKKKQQIVSHATQMEMTKQAIVTIHCVLPATC